MRFRVGGFILFLGLSLGVDTSAQAQTKPVAPAPTPSSSPSSIATVLPAVPSPLPAKELKDIKAKISLKEGDEIIKWSNSEYELKLDESSVPAKFTVDLSGTTRNADFSYVNRTLGKPIKIVSKSQISTVANIQSENQEIEFIEIETSGKIATATYSLKVSDWPSAEAILKSKSQNKNWVFNVGLGISSISFSQTNADFSTLNSLATTFKTNIDRKLGSQGYVASFSGFFNINSLSGTATGGNAFQFLGLNLKIGKMLKTLPDPWELGVHIGYYYLTMITNGTLGFNNVQGPELFPTVSRKFNNGSQALLYIKFSPIGQGFSLLSISNNEIAAGLVYRFAKKTKIQWLAGFDYAAVNFSTVDSLSNQTTTQSSSMTGWGGISF